MKSFFIALVMLAALAAQAPADEPPEHCIATSLDVAQRGLLIPDNDGSDPHPAASFTVTVKNNDCVPIANALVEVLIGGQAEGSVRLCGDAETVKLTDANGVVAFNIAGGGCYKGANAFVIRANGVIIRSFSEVMSPDYEGWDDAGIPGRTSLTITPRDLAAFFMAYQGGVGVASCHDYNNDSMTDPGDLAIFVSAYSGGTRFCSP